MPVAKDLVVYLSDRTSFQAPWDYALGTWIGGESAPPWAKKVSLAVIKRIAAQRGLKVETALKH